MNIKSLICINCDAFYKIINIDHFGLQFLGYKNIKEIEFKSITTIIPEPSSSLHIKIINELSKTYTEKSKYLEIINLAYNNCNKKKDIDDKDNDYNNNRNIFVINKMLENRAVKTILTKDNLQKKVFIYIDMKVDSNCDIYLLPLDPEGNNDLCEIPNHEELHKVGALIDVLRKIKTINDK
jgi:hypothetical protein